MKDITPLQQLKAKMNGHLGTVTGGSIAVIALVYRTITHFSWVQVGFVIFLSFIIWLQLIEFIGTRQRYEGSKKLMEEIQGNKMLNKL